MLGNTGTYISDIRVTFEHHLTGDHPPSFTVENVPDVVYPMKDRLPFVWVLNSDATTLQVVWNSNVEMKDNWYEAAVTHSAPHRIVSVVDWVSDGFVDEPAHAHLADFGFAPIPKEPAPRAPALYNVFAWGVNDPSEANRTFEHENFDALASPFGWHFVETGSEPGLKAPTYRNTSTTWGNNVFAHENWEGRNNWVHNYRPDAGPDMVFDYPYDPKKTDS